ncbi:MAG TPA: respiratory nitrate reductase subunit gamma, partial [Acidimicrobiales bacterium]|nr:respiratory nitrate reductase subunit gamma [Acidimicrobiales bacterium]
MSDRPRLKPSQVTLLVGVGLALVTAASGVIAAVAQQHDDSAVTREVFQNIPSAMRVVFYTVVPVLFLAGSWLFSQRVQNWERGQPDNRATTRKNVGRRFRDFRAGVYMQTLMRDPAAGVMHSLIYFPFLILFAVTTVLEINHQMPEGLKFLHGGVYQGYSFVGDVAGVLFLIGIGWAIVRRYVQRPYRIRIKSKPEDALILATFAIIGVTGDLAEAFRIALDGRPSFERWSVVGYPLSALFETTANLSLWHRGAWIAHFIAFCLFLVILPITKLRHMFTSPINMYLRDRERP